ncbi:phage tail assembly chaperone [Chromobacterium sp. S0633]|uniref:phage tail assembly chaperone n=1 Tax=Chromobacterium sp. S0633 TaxID=2957805 RepID=UPI0020A0C505|nr:phage tail assembly chaperone [Chromobacterium sp. S0633]MCP1290946.1 phage tail assembly chaperone [Chromobacterium sp. S0633]
MSKYFAGSSGGFYDSAIHGALMLAVVDPSWTRPTIKEPDPNWVQLADDSEATAPMIDVPDMSVTAPTITTSNPACQIPADAVEITAEQHAELMAAQSAGKIITSGANGNPIATDPPPPSTAQLAEQARAQRDRLLGDTQWIVQRHRDQIEIGTTTTLSADQFNELQAYRQALRDVPAQKGFPASITWPAVPACAQEVE